MHPMRTLVLAIAFLSAACAVGAESRSAVYVVQLNGIVGPATARYILRGMHLAESAGAQAFIIEMDTPGGLMRSMDDITHAMLGSSVPTVVYVYPSGARAASAGVFITYAADIAAMAPTTHLGAAHPVGIGPMGGSSPDKTEMTKVTNDAVAEVRGFALRRGRNITWAEQAVRQSVSITDREALGHHVINLVAENPQDLLSKIDGWKIQTRSGERRLATRDARIVEIPMDVSERFLSLIADPNVGLILMMIAMYGIIFELNYPFAVFPGVIGVIALILAFASFAVVSVNVAGLLFIGFSVILFIADIKVPTHGILTGGGLASFIFGAILLTEYQDPLLRVSIPVVVTIALITAAFFAFVIGAGVRAQRRKVQTGREALVGALGVVRNELAPEGTVFVQGALWSAETSENRIPAGESVRVLEIKGLHLKVRKAEDVK